MVRAQSLPGSHPTLAGNGPHEILADAPVEKGGGGTGFGAHDLPEASFAVCIDMAVRMHAVRNAIPLEAVTTEVRLQRPTPERVVFEWRLEMSGALSNEQRRALEQAARSSPVSQTLSKQLEFVSIS
jgi:putative redox protein